MLPKTLTPEQRELLQELVDQEGWRILERLILSAIMEEQAQRVLTVSGDSIEATQVVAAEQLRYQGMAKLAQKLRGLKAELRPGKTREPGDSSKK